MVNTENEQLQERKQEASFVFNEINSFFLILNSCMRRTLLTDVQIAGSKTHAHSYAEKVQHAKKCLFLGKTTDGRREKNKTIF